MADIGHVLLISGVGLPTYPRWGQTRSGFFSCLYQQKIECVPPKEEHADLFEQAEAYAKPCNASSRTCVWSERKRLGEIEQIERIEAIITEHDPTAVRRRDRRENLVLAYVLGNEVPDDDGQSYSICPL